MYSFFGNAFKLRSWLVAVLPLVIAGCAGVPEVDEHEYVAALPSSEHTLLGSFSKAWHTENRDYSALFELNDPAVALRARIGLIEAAEESIDAQYFLIKPDNTGEKFLSSLEAAGKRGVRVRLLIDDIFTPGMDDTFAALACNDEVDVRLFNPLARVPFRYLVSPQRINRRMHNKALVVDGAVAIFGGRNIADEYFDRRNDVVFDDYELLSFGGVVEPLADSFDSFWNSKWAIPIEIIVGDQLPNECSIEATGAVSKQLKEAANEYLEDILANEVEYIRANASVIYDDPSKLKNPARKRIGANVSTDLRELFGQAEQSITIVNPYLIPSAEGLERINNLIERGIEITILTNSLESTNHIAVHSRYIKYRRELLLAGVNLYEIDAFSLGESSSKKLTLHAKVATTDSSKLLVGSPNFDPRSRDLNSEVAVVIDSEAMASQYEFALTEFLKGHAYKLALSKAGDILWEKAANDSVELLQREPGLSFGLELKLFSILFYQ